MFVPHLIFTGQCAQLVRIITTFSVTLTKMKVKVPMLTCFVKRDLRKHSGNLNPQKNNYAQYNSRTRRAKNRQNSTKIKKTQNSTTGSTFSLPLLL